MKGILSFFKKYLPDIRFWIVLFFIVRLYGIWFPPIDTAHSWRQVTGNMVARNFYETDANILYPRVDMAGEKTGITGTEFPVLNYLIYLFTLIFGWTEWYGRLIVLLVSSIGSLYFFKLVRKFFNEKHAFFSTILLLSSNWFIYSRKIMPDTFSVSLCMIGLWFAILYLEKHKLKHLISAWLLVLLGVLSKIPAVIILLPLIFIFLEKTYSLKSKIILSVTFIPSFLIVFWWYFIWVPDLVKTFGYWHYYMGTNLKQGLIELFIDKKDVLEKFYFDALKYSGFIIFSISLIFLYIKKDSSINHKVLKYFFGLSVFVFFIFMLKSGRNFGVHSYYIIPFVPFMTLIAGWGLSELKKTKVAFTILLIVSIEGIANQQHDFKIKDNRMGMLKYETVLNNFADKSDLIVINGDVNPSDLYFTHHKGWTMSNEELSQPERIDSLVNLGCKWVILNPHYSNKPMLNLPLVFKDENMELYKSMP